jgi:TRAP transporter TAXI family solute receptor
LLLAGLAAGGGLLAACSSAPGPAPTSAPAAGAPAGQPTAAAAGQPTGAKPNIPGLTGAKLTIAGASSGSATFVKMVQFSQLLNQGLGTEAAVEASAGNAAAPDLIQSKQVDFATTYEGLLNESYSGVGWYDKKPHPDLRSMAYVGLHLIQFYVPTNSTITKIQDLAGKRVSLSTAGAGVDAYARRIFDKLGIKPDKIVNGNPADATDLLKQGQLDACGVMGYIHPTIVSAASTMAIRAFGVDPSLAAQVNQVLPTLQVYTIPANSYVGQDKEFQTLGDREVLFTHKDQPEELVYQMTKTAYGNVEKFGALEPSVRMVLSKPEMIKNSPVPVHKGAARYFKEAGIELTGAATPK